MANIKKINELEVIDNEENITGTENVLVEKDGTAKLVPMNMIKASSGGGAAGGYVIDMTSDEYRPNDTAYGDAILELIRNGTPITVYTASGHYSPVVLAFVEKGTDWGDSAEAELILAYYEWVGGDPNNIALRVTG
jgi:hypothetical protein